MTSFPSLYFPSLLFPSQFSSIDPFFFITNMARFISKTLFRHHSLSLNPLLPSSMTLSLRHRSSQSPKPLIEVDLTSSSSSSSPSSAEYDVALMLFDDIIQRILVKKATPDWLPFVPGSSFWVPPRPSRSNVVEFVHKITNEISEDESISLAMLQGWPSSKYFIQDIEPTNDGDTGTELNIPEGMDSTVKLKVLAISENVAHSEDEEG